MMPKRKKPPLAARASRSGESCDDGRYTEQAQGHIQLHDDGETKVLAHSNVPRLAAQRDRQGFRWGTCKAPLLALDRPALAAGTILRRAG